MVEDEEEKLDEIRKLYPQMTAAELKIAWDNLRRYAQIIWRIYSRLKAEDKSWPKLDR